MGLWKRVKRLLPLGAFVVAAAYAIAYKPFETKIEPRITKIEQQGKELARKKFGMWLLSGSALSLAALGAAHIVQRKKGKRPSFLQPAVEHSYWSGGIAAFAYGLAAEAQINDPLFSAYAGGCFGLLTTAVTAALSHVKPPYAINYPQNIIDSLRTICTPNNPAREQAILERIRTYRSQPAHVDLELVDVLLRQEKVDEALDALKRGISCLDQAVAPFALERSLVRPLAYEIVVATPQSWRGRFWGFYTHLRQGDLGDALAALDTFVEADKGLNHIAARAYILQTLTDLWPVLQRSLPKRYASKQSDLGLCVQIAWRETIASILADADREKQFRLMGESRNEVLEYAPNAFLQGLLVFKRCDVSSGERLRDEHDSMLLLSEQFGSQIAQSLAYVEHEGKAYHVLRHGTNRTLEQVILEGKAEDGSKDAVLAQWKDAATLLARIHNIPVESTSITQEYYTNRLMTVFYDQVKQSAHTSVPHAITEVLPKIGARVFVELHDAPLGRYKDANWRNWLVDGSVVAIDFEHRVQLPVPLDLVSLLESGPASQAERLVVREHYVRILRQHRTFERDAFLRQYSWAALQRHLEFAGYRARDHEYQAVQFHIARAKEYADELGEKAFAQQLAAITVAS